MTTLTVMQQYIKWCTLTSIAACFALDLSSQELIIATSCLCLMCMASVYKFDFSNAWVAFAAPWIIVLSFAASDLSDYSRSISATTIGAVAMSLACALLFIKPTPRKNVAFDGAALHRDRFKYLIAIYAAFTALNIGLAGYIPLIRAILEGDSGYMDFGVPGIYGLYNAYANALGVSAFYFWLRDGDKLYRNSFIAIAAIFTLFVTRQNIISLAVECFIIYSLCVRRISGLRLLTIACAMLVGFGALGDLRLGEIDISQLAGIKAQYHWLPRASLWLYAYSYFNILNLDNVVGAFPTPLLDGSSLIQLVPSFLRPDSEYDGQDLLEVGNFNVTSFISPIYQDFGLIGVGIIVITFSCAAQYLLSRTERRGEFFSTASYAVLYFCFAFSFFVNFWFYLPVIFQPAFIWLFSKFLLKKPG